MPPFVLLAALTLGSLLSGVQGPPTSDLVAAVGRLGAFDFAARTEAARVVRRAPAPIVVPALEAAARSHADEYVRFKALVLLSGIDAGAMTRVAADLATDRNDRVRTVVYQWFEQHPHTGMLPRLLDNLPRETSEFVRPALTSALAASWRDTNVQQVLRPLVLRGEDHFRGSVIAALGEHGALFAMPELLTVVRLEGPLQDDAITALGQLAVPSSRPVVAALQKSVPAELQPTVSAALCLMGIDCVARVAFVVDTLRYASAAEGQAALLRGAVHAAAMLARGGHAEVFDALVDAALTARGAARDAVVLGVGVVILRQPLMAFDEYEQRQQPQALATLYRDAFDMLSEDFDEESFGAAVRRAFWAAPEGSVKRTAAASLLDALEF
jgi:hypothetical protein